jgi:hypothetical protein
LLTHIALLRGIDWGWSQDEVKVVALRAGWQPAGGGWSTAGYERRKYTNPAGWQWTVNAEEGRLYQMTTVFGWLEWGAGAAAPEIESCEEQVATEYAGYVALLRGCLGPERYAGEWSENEARFQSFEFEDAVQLAEWGFGSGSLTLSLCEGRLLRLQGGWMTGCWLEVVLHPKDESARPVAAPDRGGIR